ncbi:hypothetical protein SAMN05216588_102241 [Pseudomonas flavescens]|uniref:Uncharacterized protein n=1 Tax=Phytopseudomonas flavescens TaxID=29435 RepID=A0A1G7Z8A3_9GAMM|nr:hypothetical protein [Pseudomonas flavescens]SDH04835.1 hypothetical protein SAMN05216588_102241 [Pseudomonas flavescens]
MSILIGLGYETVFNAAMATQIVFQQPASAGDLRAQLALHCCAQRGSLLLVSMMRSFVVTGLQVQAPWYDGGAQP